MNIDDLSIKIYKQYDKDGKYHNLFADDDLNEVDIITDEDGNILEEVYTGNCACRSCKG